MSNNPFSPSDIPARQLYEDFLGHGYTHDEAVKLARRQSLLVIPNSLRTDDAQYDAHHEDRGR